MPLQNESENIQTSKKTIAQRLIGFIKWSLILATLFFTTAIGLVVYFEDDVKNLVIKELNKSLKAEVKIDPKNIDLTILKSFPKCALEFKNVLILEAVNKKKRDTLIYAGNISLMFNVKDIIKENYKIKKINISNAICNLQVDKNGKPNYIFWKKNKTETANDSLHFALEKILLKNVSVSYKNSATKVKTELTIKECVFAGRFSDDNYNLKTSGLAQLNSLLINKSAIINNKILSYDFDFSINKHHYLIKTAELGINSMFFSIDGNFNYIDSLTDCSLKFKGKNIDITSVVSLLPPEYSERMNDYESEGVFFTAGDLNYTAGKPILLNAQFGINKAVVTYKPKNTKLKNLNLKGILAINEKESYVNFENITSELGNNTFNGNCHIRNFDNPNINLNADINTRLDELNAFWPIDTLEYISGSLNLKAGINGNLNEIKESAFSPNIKAEGAATLNEVKLKVKGKPNEINIKEGGFSLNNRYLNVNNLTILTGKSDIKLTGSLPDFLNYLFDNKSDLIINADMQCENLFLEDVLYSGSKGGERNNISIPANLGFNLTSKINKLYFANFEAAEITGKITIKNQKVALSDLDLKTMDGKAKVNALADATGESIKITASAELSRINITKLFYQLNNFGQSTLIDKNIKGYSTANVDFSGIWNKALEADLKSVSATASITIEEGELINFKPLESLSDYVELNELKNIKFASLQSVIDIKNEIISIPKTTIKNSALNIDVWGKHTFNNEIDYHIKLLLSELLASKKRKNKQLDEELREVENDPENKRSVFVLMTGTVDKPIIKYDRKGLKQKISEDIKTEKQNLKQLLKEEFGLFKKDTTLKKNQTKPDEKFNIEFGDKNDKKQKDLNPKKKEDDDDDF